VGELGHLHTFDTKGSHTLVDGIQGIFYIDQSSIPKLKDDGPYQFAPAFRCNGAELARYQFHRPSYPYLGENVVKENEYRSAMIHCQEEEKRRGWEDQRKGSCVVGRDG
jgi:hypothetical protein